ncbi:ketoacyl-ACP synthase III family protein [Amycolatopsis sp. NPDC049691]|uniref:ketoacyl-ACP synthase III family protein n=1 Tax=Amycolatopsis sp. NPDC049691 TaxID=3155155 RepID=UPI003420FFFC
MTETTGTSTRVDGIHLAGIGTFVPDAVSVRSAARRGLVDEETSARSGISGVAVAGDLPATEMAVRAGAEAIKNSGLAGADIRLLLYAGVWHQGPDGWGPQYFVQRELLGDDVLAVEVRQGCNGFFTALELAVPYLAAAPEGTAALIVASDNFGTPLIDRWQLGDGLAYLGDGASAVTVSRAPGPVQLRSLCSASYSEMEGAHRSGLPLFPPGVTVGTSVDFRSRAESFRDAAISGGWWMRFLAGHNARITQCANRALEEAGVARADVKYVLTHGMPRQSAISYLRLLGFPFERSTWDFARTIGHLGASDHFVALHHLLTEGALGAGDHVLLSGYSPGLTYKSAVLRITADAPATA